MKQLIILLLISSFCYGQKGVTIAVGGGGVTDGNKVDVTVSGATWTVNNGVISTAKLADNSVTIAKLSATGTPSATTYLNGIGEWATPGGSGTASLNKNATIEWPSNAENIAFGWKTPVAITITSVESVIQGTSTPSVTFNIVHGTSRSTGNNVFTAGQTVTSTTTGLTSNSGFNDNTVPAGSWVWIITTAIGGSPSELGININYTED